MKKKMLGIRFRTLATGSLFALAQPAWAVVSNDDGGTGTCEAAAYAECLDQLQAGQAPRRNVIDFAAKPGSLHSVVAQLSVPEATDGGPINGIYTITVPGGQIYRHTVTNPGCDSKCVNLTFPGDTQIGKAMGREFGLGSDRSKVCVNRVSNNSVSTTTKLPLDTYEFIGKEAAEGILDMDPDAHGNATPHFRKCTECLGEAIVPKNSRVLPLFSEKAFAAIQAAGGGSNRYSNYPRNCNPDHENRCYTELDALAARKLVDETGSKSVPELEVRKRALKIATGYREKLNYCLNQLSRCGIDVPTSDKALEKPTYREKLLLELNAKIRTVNAKYFTVEEDLTIRGSASSGRALLEK